MQTPTTFTRKPIDLSLPAELCFNFIANAVTPFFKLGRNWFDVLVVFVSLALLYTPATSNGSIKQLRILRVFRIIRVFGRVGQLREIAEAIMLAILPALQAVIIGLIVIAVFASLAVQYFAGEAESNFCDFFHAFYTLFDLLAYQQETGLQAFNSEGAIRSGVVAFLYAYVGIVVFVQLQVVVAVTLESFYRARLKFKEEAAHEDAVAARQAMGEYDSAEGTSLDPILEDLSFAYDSERSLMLRLNALYDRLNVDKCPSIRQRDLLVRLGALDLKVTKETIERLSDNKRFCGKYGEMNRYQFTQAMLAQLKSFAQRRIADSLHLQDLGVDMEALLATVKFSMLEFEQVQTHVRTLREDTTSLKSQIDIIRNELQTKVAQITKFANSISNARSVSTVSTDPGTEAVPSVGQSTAGAVENGDGHHVAVALQQSRIGSQLDSGRGSVQGIRDHFEQPATPRSRTSAINGAGH
mmetsp:Transcript_86151/g.229964  ORF Transcript_86151/g.229964 Transcript_86151/m.229964 type:complete len:469 (+) Transcript_86151:1168-2574(+)